MANTEQFQPTPEEIADYRRFLPVHHLEELGWDVVDEAGSLWIELPPEHNKIPFYIAACLEVGLDEPSELSKAIEWKPIGQVGSSEFRLRMIFEGDVALQERLAFTVEQFVAAQGLYRELRGE